MHTTGVDDRFQHPAQSNGVGLGPLFRLHGLAILIIPMNVITSLNDLIFRFVDIKAAAQQREFPTYANYITNKIPEFPLTFGEVAPVNPGNFIILAIGIVVSLLRVTNFVTGKYHRCSLT